MNIQKIKIEDTDIFLEDHGNNMGKITVSDTNYDRNYSYFWGSMGGEMINFLCEINKEYFADKLMGPKSSFKMDVRKTFANLRKYITTEMDLPWYLHPKFQKEMREELNYFQKSCMERPTAEFFVDNFFRSFVDNLPFFEIEDNYEMESVKKKFNNLSEVWYFIFEKPNEEIIWLQKLHKKLVKKLKQKQSILLTNGI